MANHFEKEIEDLFPAIRKRTGAFLFRLYPPTRCVGMRGSMPVFVQTGRALFDVAGWLPAVFEDLKKLKNPAAITIGIELKSTTSAHTSLAIIGEDGRGSGLQAHQLEALAAVHRDGGIAKLVWNNGGIVGMLDGDGLEAAFFHYGVSLQAERARKNIAKGSRSISWKMFRVIGLSEHPEEIVTRNVPTPTLKETLQVSDKVARQQIDEYEEDPDS